MITKRPDLAAMQIVGGNGAAALVNKDTVVDLAAGTIHTLGTYGLPRLRAVDSDGDGFHESIIDRNDSQPQSLRSPVGA